MADKTDKNPSVDVESIQALREEFAFIDSMMGGTFSGSIDSNGRASLPGRLRETLGDTFVLTKEHSGQLAIFSLQGYKKIFDQINEAIARGERFSKQTQLLINLYCSGQTVVKPDKLGRFTIPPELRKWASLRQKSEVWFVGSFDRVVVMNKTTHVEWEKKQGTVDFLDQLTDQTKERSSGQGSGGGRVS